MQQRRGTNVLVGTAAGTFADIVRMSVAASRVVPTCLSRRLGRRVVCERWGTATFPGDVQWPLYSASKILLDYR